MKPLFVYNFHRCIGNNHKNVQACGGVCGVFAGGVMVWGGGHEDATTDEGMSWLNEGKKQQQKN